ncbi:MAG: histidine kinase [Cellvibrionales bacterium]|nr:histidine kinase [Cellvibrionales bacterium]
MLFSRQKAIKLKGADILPDLSTHQALMVLMALAQIVVVMDRLLSDGPIIDWEALGLTTLYVQWQALSSALVLSLIRPILAKFNEFLALWVAFGFLVAWALLISVVVQFLSIWWLVSDNSVMDWQFVQKNTLLSAILIGIALHYMYLQRRLIIQHKAEVDARLLALQSKMKPHFLFNSLNSVAQLIYQKPQQAEDMLVDLSQLLRASLGNDSADSSIEEEWALCEHYLSIEKHRLEKRLDWSFDFSNCNLALPMLRLSLQPLIENAVYHGIQMLAEGGEIKVKGVSFGTKVTIVVENSVKASQEKTHKGQQMALKNLQQRLARRFGGYSSLSEAHLGRWYQVTLVYDAKGVEG